MVDVTNETDSVNEIRSKDIVPGKLPDDGRSPYNVSRFRGDWVNSLPFPASTTGRRVCRISYGPVATELSGNVVDDKGANELFDCQAKNLLVMQAAHLEDDANQDEALVLSLFGRAVPP